MSPFEAQNIAANFILCLYFRPRTSFMKILLDGNQESGNKYLILSYGSSTVKRGRANSCPS